MTNVVIYIAIIASFLPLPAMGWDWASDAVPLWMKFHLATYIFAFTASLKLLTFKLAYWRNFASWSIAPLVVTSAIFVICGSLIMWRSDEPTGAFGLAITNFLTPVLFIFSTSGFASRQWKIVGGIIRVLVVISSIIAVVEYNAGTSIFFEQHSRLFRSGGLFGHPLSSSLLTGIVMVYIISSTNKSRSMIVHIPELILHTVALFAFGGRAGLILVPLVVGVSAFLPFPGISALRKVMQRGGVALLILAGIMVTQMQVGIVEGAMTRFESDSGSAATRISAVEMVVELPTDQLLWGVGVSTRDKLLIMYETEIAFENPWVNLILSFGLVLTILMFVSLMIALFSRARNLDRSAYIMLIYFLIATNGYISFGSKSLAILQVMAMVSGFCQRRDFGSDGRSPLDQPSLQDNAYAADSAAVVQLGHSGGR